MPMASAERILSRDILHTARLGNLNNCHQQSKQITVTEVTQQIEKKTSKLTGNTTVPAMKTQSTT